MAQFQRNVLELNINTVSVHAIDSVLKLAKIHFIKVTVCDKTNLGKWLQSLNLFYLCMVLLMKMKQTLIDHDWEDISCFDY
jgi:hypothetical protein